MHIKQKDDCMTYTLFFPFEYQQPCAVPDPHLEIRGGGGASPGSATDVLIQVLFFSFSSFFLFSFSSSDRLSYFRTLIIIIINIKSFHTVSLLSVMFMHYLSELKY